MTEHWFYHLQQSSIEQVLPDILEKTYGQALGGLWSRSGLALAVLPSN